MAVIDEFSAGALMEALRSIAGVLQDHAGAIDSLDASVDPVGQTPRVPDGGSVESPSGSGGHTALQARSTDASDLPGPLGVGSGAAAALAWAIEAAGSAKDLVTLTSRMGRAASTGVGGAGGRVVGHLLRALAEISSTTDSIDAERFALALEVAAELAASDPHDQTPGGDHGGTGGVVAVLSAASVGALRAVDQDMSLVDVMIAAADEGLDELESGVATNERLAEAGVVDAAGAVFLLILDSFAAVASGDPLPEPPARDSSGEEHDAILFRVSCVARPTDTDVPGRRDPARDGVGQQWLETCAWIEAMLAGHGTLVGFVAGSDRCELEVLTAEAGRVIESICAVARPTELSVSLADQRERTDGVPTDPFGPERSI